jgi:signal transduction histidine kinase
LKELEQQNTETVGKLEGAVSYISEILSLQQHYAATEEEIRQRVALSRLLEDAIRVQMGALDKRGIRVERDFDPQMPDLIIDKNRLVQVLVNIIKNGYEAMDGLKDGPVEKVMRFKSYKENGWAAIDISDTGIGLEPQDNEVVFQYGKSKKGSSGFGLYYCKMFVESNKGLLTIQSPGKGMGATVSIKLPIANG